MLGFVPTAVKRASSDNRQSYFKCITVRVIFNENLVIVVTLIHMYIYMYAKMVVVRFTNELYSIDINLIAVKEPRYAYCSLAVEAAA